MFLWYSRLRRFLQALSQEKQWNKHAGIQKAGSINCRLWDIHRGVFIFGMAVGSDPHFTIACVCMQVTPSLQPTDTTCTRNNC